MEGIILQDQKRFTQSTLAEVEKFLHAPAQWSAAHGGAPSFPEA